MRKLNEDKKGNLQEALHLAGPVILILLVIAIISIVAFLVIDNMSSSVSTVETTATGGPLAVLDLNVNATNSTYGGVILPGCKPYSGVTIVDLNATNGTILTGTNWTLSGCKLTVTAGSTSANTYWNISYNFTYKFGATGSSSIATNQTLALTNFFTQIPTIMTILGIVVLIGAIVLIIYFVSRMSGGNAKMPGL